MSNYFYADDCLVCTPNNDFITLKLAIYINCKY